MATEVAMPQMGADMTEGTVVKWHKGVGEQIERGEILADIETDKATVELEAYESGVILKQVVDEGETVPVGQVIAVIGDASEAVAEVERKPAAETPVRRRIETEKADEGAPAAEAAPAATRAEAPAPAVPSGEESRLRISPVARRIAAESGIDVRGMRGSGPDGRILRRDVEAVIADRGGAGGRAEEAAPAAAAPTLAVARPAPSPAAPSSGVVTMSRMRQAIARRMTTSKQTQPHYYLTLDVDMTEALAFRTGLNAVATEEQRVSINDLIIKASAIALQRHPKFNAEYAEGGLRMREKINIDIGIALDEGLIAPAIVDCGTKSLGWIAGATKDLINRAKNGHLRPEEYSEGTFTITNLGAYGVESLIGIINPPQSAILGVGSVGAKPVVVDEQIVVRQVVKLALSADHRVTDGAEGARFLTEIRGLLENPASLAL